MVFLRAITAPLSAPRRAEPPPGVPFSRETAANPFTTLCLLPETLAQEILGNRR